MMRATLTVALLLLPGCVHGTRLRTFTPAISPAGVQVSFRVDGERAPRSGELFGVDTAGITVLADQLMHLSWSRLLVVRVPGRGTYFDRSDRRGQAADLKAQLALLSRFPQGLEGPLLAEVLRSVKQDSLVRVH